MSLLILVLTGLFAQQKACSHDIKQVQGQLLAASAFEQRY